MPNIDNIVKQLKNRKVFRSLAIYAGFSFVLLQVCDIVIPRLFLPEWTMTFIIVLVIIGFPIIAVLSWIYDITPSEDGETPPTEAKQQLGIYALTGLVLTVIGIGFWVSISVFGLSFGDDEVPSIAIIPFDNKGADEDDFYAYSISSELISDIAGAGLIRVASLKRIEELDDIAIEQKAEKLDVRYITTGSIWKADSVFQLSMEIYDTKISKVLWSESWQKDWDDLASIKGNLAKNILKALKVSTKQDFNKIPTSNTEAYEYYLKAKDLFITATTEKDIDKAIKLCYKAIDLDKDFMALYQWLAWIYYNKHDYINAFKYNTYYNELAIKFESFIDVAWSYLYLGDVIYFKDNNVEETKRLYNLALKIFNIHDHTFGISTIYYNLAYFAWKEDFNLETANDYYNKTIKLDKKIRLKEGDIFAQKAKLNFVMGDFDEAKNNIDISIGYHKSNNNNNGYKNALMTSGKILFYNQQYENSIKDLTESLEIFQQYYNNPDTIPLGLMAYLNLSKKKYGKRYNNDQITELIKETEYINYEYNYLFYMLLEEPSYLNTAYNQIKEKADNLEPDLKAKFLSYPIPKAIVEEWEKVK